SEELNSEMTKNYNDLSLNYSYLLKPNMIIHASVSNVLGFDNIFGYQFNSEPNEPGIYESIPIKSQAKRFLFVGFFITISKDKNANQLNNL
ncbi:MAG: TonB-dependent receptor, partial [Cyclobacteriaceae bacterium]|nr:TonB-dependent receptor [Cyclobacteriaceae bacterium]